MSKQNPDTTPPLTPDQLSQLKGWTFPNVGDLSGLSHLGQGGGGYLPNAPVGFGAWAPPGGNTTQPATPPPARAGKPAKAKAAAPAAAAPQAPAPAFDPLALQQMWSSVFGPAFAQAAKIQAGAAPNYLDAMTKAISGSNQSDAAKADQLNNAKATSALIQALAGNQAGQLSAGPSFDTLIQWLQQSTGASQLAQGAAEKNLAYGGALQNAAAFGSQPAANALGTLSLGGVTGALTPAQTAALTQQAIAGTQTGQVNPFLPNAQLQAQGLNPSGITTTTVP